MPTDVTDKNGSIAAECDIGAKGKGKGKATEEGQVPIKGSVDNISDDEDDMVEEGGDDEDDDEDEEDESEVEDDDEDEEEGSEKIDPTNIRSRRTRGVRVDYTSKEALAKAGLPLDEKEDDKMEY